MGVCVQAPGSDNDTTRGHFGLLGLGLLIACLLHVVGVVLGIAGLVQRERKKPFAVLELCVNGLVLIAGVGLIGIGIVVRLTRG